MGKIDGIMRDENGIVIARRDRHPLADKFKAIPAGTAQTVFNMDPLFQHVLAIHMFDNLDCSPPRNPLYEYREPTSGHSGLNGGIWVPNDTPTPDFIVPEGETVTVPDPRGWPKEKRDAMKVLLQEEEIRQNLVAGADPIYRGEGVESEGDEAK